MVTGTAVPDGGCVSRCVPPLLVGIGSGSSATKSSSPALRDAAAWPYLTSGLRAARYEKRIEETKNAFIWDGPVPRRQTRLVHPTLLQTAPSSLPAQSVAPLRQHLRIFAGTTGRTGSGC